MQFIWLCTWVLNIAAASTKGSVGPATDGFQLLGASQAPWRLSAGLALHFWLHSSNGRNLGPVSIGAKHFLEQLPCRRQLGCLLERCQHNNKHYHNCSKSVGDPHT